MHSVAASETSATQLDCEVCDAFEVAQRGGEPHAKLHLRRCVTNSKGDTYVNSNLLDVYFIDLPAISTFSS